MVVPSASNLSFKHDLVTPARLGVRRLRAGTANLFQRWRSLQVSYRGHRCSIERLLALEQYTRTTSLWRVMTVVAGTLVPMVVLVISQESIPLNDPAAGWRVNYGFWMRVGILAGVVSVGVAMHARYILGAALFTSRHLVLLFICQALTYTFVSMGIAALVGFPIPFFTLSTIPVFFVLLTVWFTAIIGRKTVRDMLKRSDEMKIHAQFICAQMLMPIAYPIYEVLFVAAMNTHYELPVILLLPIMKVVMKYIITLALVQKEDMLPESVILSVDFFHAVYLATPVFIFGMLEFVSFALLAVMIYEKYGMQAFYHLAFVLETQVALVQCKVMMWMLIILAFRVVHFGVDFTLKFAWIKN
ncbi:uncharacterized protein IUM83_02584 [Phytophthora cinnamomi]|uniref:uncharacterized protein n=1 Tax=Phytophthora cinnamomi TaxID=4785 RepID=UPI0035599F62|nr:hypothetical protein IUM83_02584 [Phytophthora cinnamomi]